MSAPHTVCPYRFTDDVAAVVRFLEVVGLRRAVTSRGGDFAILAGRRGLVAVHPTGDGAVTGVGSGGTSLVFVVDNAVTAVDALSRRGFDAVCWDESYGKQGAVRDPFGRGVWVNERISDLYGFVEHLAAPSTVDVVAVYRTDEPTRAASFFEGLGFGGPPPEHDGWWPRHAVDGGGTVGLHAGDLESGPLSADDPVSPAALVGLVFGTTEPLDALGARLRAAGYEVRDDRDCVAPHLTVTDPDGVEVELHQA